MLKKLFEDLFENVKNEVDNNSTSKNGISTYFVEKVIDEKFNKPNLISVKAFKGYYEKYVEERENNSGEPKTELKNLMSKYLGYNDFQEYVSNNKKEKKSNYKNINVKNIIYIVLIIFISSLATFQITKKEPLPCIEWNIDHYETIDCKGEYPNPILRDVDIENFKKIQVNRSSNFYKYDKPIVWYGKSKNGNIEFFNSRGLHPETLKELKPITDYIIEKYVEK